MAPVRGRILALMLVAAGCSLDFTVRPQPTDAGGSPPFDAGNDDAGPITDGGADVADVFVFETGPDGSPDCNALKIDLDERRRVARLCQQTGTYCATKVTDECDCKIPVGKPDSSATEAYADAIAKFKNAGCEKIGGYCQTCPNDIAGSCLVQGTATSCYP